MTTYRITNRTSGADLGLFDGETPEQALDAMARDAGADSHADSMRRLFADAGYDEEEMAAACERAAAELSVEEVEAGSRTPDAWWQWHDADSSRHSASVEEAEARCAAWVSGTSDDGPEEASEPESTLTTYRCTDGNADVDIEAESAEDAAQEYVDGGEWGMDEEGAKTTWIDVWCTPLDEDGEPDEDEREKVTITLQPTEPECSSEDGHDWQSPIEVVGGIEENPGVWGKGGGVTITEVCSHCGCYRDTDTWAQRPDTGEQGLRSVSYRAADEQSSTWARRQHESEDDRRDRIIADLDDRGAWDETREGTEEQPIPDCARWAVVYDGDDWCMVSAGGGGTPTIDLYGHESKATMAMHEAIAEYDRCQQSAIRPPVAEASRGGG